MSCRFLTLHSFARRRWCRVPEMCIRDSYKTRDIKSGRVVENTCNAGTKFESVMLTTREFQYLYNDGTDYIFMEMCIRDSTRSAFRTNRLLFIDRSFRVTLICNSTAVLFQRIAQY